MQINRPTAWMVLGTAGLALLVCAIGVTLTQLKGPTFYDIELGSLSSTQRQFNIKAPDCWFAGMTVSVDPDTASPEQRIGVEIVQDNVTIFSRTISIIELPRSNWVPGGYKVPLQSDGASLRQRLGYQAEFRIIARAERPESRVTARLRFVDDRLWKPTGAKSTVFRLEPLALPQE